MVDVLGMDSAFSIAANAFAVIGVCDVVVRRTTQCVDYFQQCRNASTNVPKLLRELTSHSTIATHVRVFLVEYNTSPFVRQDNQVLIDFDTILRDCEAELGWLPNVAWTSAFTSTDSLLARFPRTLSWGLCQDGFETSCLKMARDKSSLAVALSVTGRYGYILNQSAISASNSEIFSLGRTISFFAMK